MESIPQLIFYETGQFWPAELLSNKTISKEDVYKGYDVKQNARKVGDPIDLDKISQVATLYLGKKIVEELYHVPPSQEDFDKNALEQLKVVTKFVEKAKEEALRRIIPYFSLDILVNPSLTESASIFGFFKIKLNDYVLHPTVNLYVKRE